MDTDRGRGARVTTVIDHRDCGKVRFRSATISSREVERYDGEIESRREEPANADRVCGI